MNRRFLFLFLLMLIFALFPSSLQAITYTWDGGGGADTHWNVGTNWVGDVAPAFTSTSNQDDLVFGNTYASTTITMRNESSTDYYRSITFTADAPAYTLVEELSSGVGAIYNRSSVVPSGSPNLPSSSFITNASQNQQKLDCWVSNRLFAASTNGYIGINLNNAIMSGSVEIPNLWL
ncbi:MAG: hypothetical protein IT426_15765, partial [Pirellulales bacterium]|nr:hypothetical protein [Pirellulales bacterium]